MPSPQKLNTIWGKEFHPTHSKKYKTAVFVDDTQMPIFLKLEFFFKIKKINFKVEKCF